MRTPGVQSSPVQAEPGAAPDRGPMRRFDLERLIVCSFRLKAGRRAPSSNCTTEARMFRAFACTAFAALLIVTPQAQTGTTIRIWKVGSPHTGDTPDTEMPPALAREAGSRGWRLSIDAFPAQAFADRFFAAGRNGTAPDVLVLDNVGTIDGIVTKLGRFVGIGQDPVIRNQLIQVTSSFDELGASDRSRRRARSPSRK